MIVDRLCHADCYAALHPRFAAAFAFLKRGDVSTLPPGRYEIDGDNVFALVQSYVTHDPEPRRFEVHRRYVDVQFIAEGRERIGVADLSTLQWTEPYDEPRDAAFLTGAGVDVELAVGGFMVLFPHDAHQPCLHPAGGPASVRKIVVKVRVP
jgi:YhcH/YjgK/YiaL family protein